MTIRSGMTRRQFAKAAAAATAGQWFTNLAGYVGLVGAGTASEGMTTRAQKPPEPVAMIEGSWALAVLPDTQVYAMRHPDIFEAQTRWIAENQRKRHIKYVLHLGDVTNNNNKPQWTVARKAFRHLDGVVPYAIAPGNHDYGPRGSAATRQTLFDEYFPVEDFRKWPTFGGTFEKDKPDNNYHLFSAGATDWIILALEWGPRDEVVAWANKVLERHAGRRAIVITHAYLYSDDTLYDWASKGGAQGWNPHGYPTAKLPGGVNDGQELWGKLVSRHENVVMTLNGHVLNDGLGRLSSEGQAGNTVHQMLFNFQMCPQGGGGYLVLLEFRPSGRTVQVKTYSPVLQKCKTGEATQFELRLSPPLKPWSARRSGRRRGERGSRPPV